MQQPLQLGHRAILTTARNEIHGFINFALCPGCFEAPSALIPASPQLPLHCADSPSAAGFEKEVLGQRVKSIPFQSF